MKAVGLSIVMAQSGLYVPAEKFEYKPYEMLMTRITGNDDILKGLSSFAIEMIELQNIIKRANDNTLIIGDEICRSTEVISANSIVASAVMMLSKKKSSFIFATHLHELVKLDEIKSLENVKPYHLSVIYNETDDTIIYERELKEGNGNPIYGIEVAKYIIKDKEFIENAQKIKNKLLNETNNVLTNKKSRYNGKLYMDKCYLCGSNENLETHHLIEQKEFKEGNKSKNNLGNLIVICNECHKNIHKQNKHLKNHLTTTGVKLN
jgi:DNA mismatch repair protein MutS